jgi:hypothetical protein
MEKESDQYFTPKWVFDELGLSFDLDVASPIDKETYVPAKRKLTINDDGLTTNWQGLVWMNPPYSAPKLWVEKFIKHNNGVSLLCLSKSNWFQKLWNADCDIVIMPTNFKWHNNKQIQFQTALFAFGDESKKALEKFGKVR